MIHGLAAALFLGMAILFLGAAVSFNQPIALIFAILNGLLFLLNLAQYGKSEQKQ